MDRPKLKLIHSQDSIPEADSAIIIGYDDKNSVFQLNLFISLGNIPTDQTITEGIMVKTIKSKTDAMASYLEVIGALASMGFEILD